MPTNPQLSVIMPVRNAEASIAAQLEALSRQSFVGRWELIVANNGSSDASIERVLRWRPRFSALRIVDATTARGSYEARNFATRAARAPYLAYCDADDVVGPRWLEAIAEGLQAWPLVTGPIDLTALNPLSLVAWRRQTCWQRLPSWHGFLPGALTSNLGLRRELFDALGGFTVAQSASDLRFVWAAQLSGYELGYAEEAVVQRREPTSWLRYVRRSIRYGSAEPHLYREFRASGMPRSSLRRAGLRWIGVVAGWPALAVPDWRYAWLDVAALRTGRLLGSIRARTVYL